jgi:hypothetical protein
MTARENTIFWILACLLILIVMSCSGCAPQPTRTVVEAAKPIEIPVVVVEPCLTPGQIPALPRNLMPGPTATVEPLANGNAANVENVKTLIETQRKLLEGCAKLQQQPEKR